MEFMAWKFLIDSCPENKQGDERQASSPWFRCISNSPAIVRERLVGLGHAVRVFLFLDGVAFAL